MKIEWLPVAVRNRQDQLEWLGARNPQAAVAMGDAIAKALRRLADHPDSGRPGRIAGTRELVIAGTPYIAAYRIEPGVVVILRLLHHAQQWPDA